MPSTLAVHEHDDSLPHHDNLSAMLAGFVAEEPSDAAVQSTWTLKHNDTFLVTDSFGDVNGARMGLFHNDTRVLSTLRVTFGGHAPSMLSQAMSRDSAVFSAHLTNKTLASLGHGTEQGVLHLAREQVVWDDRLFVRLTCSNYGVHPATVPLSLHFDSDFRDMFEVRGSHRDRQGTHRPSTLDENSVTLTYHGLDGVLRATTIALSVTPDRLTDERADLMIRLDPEESTEIYVEIDTLGGHQRPRRTPGAVRHRRARVLSRLAMRARRANSARVSSSDRRLHAWLERSRADLALLVSDFFTGPYPCAGIPWYATPFGRDGIITALQTLWVQPSLARGVLRYLAMHQAEVTSTFQDSAPGKIMHETRKGEMCAVRELPFARYYGGVDSTPLFVMLAGAYHERTGDVALVQEIWPALVRAIRWVEEVQDLHPDGLVSYARGEDSGLANQGWKDSQDSVFHEDGTLATGPIALVEVQGYAFNAFQTMARLARLRRDERLARLWDERAERLQRVVEARFWMPERGFYGIAIDGQGRLCTPLTSNAGHLLFSGLIDAERAQPVIQTLMGPVFRSGWGLRTLATGQARYNPMSYHDGSVWPHDTSICASGMRRYGDGRAAAQVLDEMIDVSEAFGTRMPELYCGFPRKAGHAPIAYPVACLPQAWAAGSVFLMVQACLGLRIDGVAGTAVVEQPVLPAGIDRIVVDRLELGTDRVSLRVERQGVRLVVSVTGSADGVRRVRGDHVERHVA